MPDGHAIVARVGLIDVGQTAAREGMIAVSKDMIMIS
jgi:hypothetical protein